MALTKKQAHDKICTDGLLMGGQMRAYNGLWSHGPITATGLSRAMQTEHDKIEGHPCYHKRLADLEKRGLVSRSENSDPAQRRHGKVWSIIPGQLPGPMPPATKGPPKPTSDELRLYNAIVDDLARKGRKGGSHGGAFEKTRAWLKSGARPSK